MIRGDRELRKTRWCVFIEFKDRKWENKDDQEWSSGHCKCVPILQCQNLLIVIAPIKTHNWRKYCS
jgi:hypothetical protein